MTGLYGDNTESGPRWTGAGQGDRSAPMRSEADSSAQFKSAALLASRERLITFTGRVFAFVWGPALVVGALQYLAVDQARAVSGFVQAGSAFVGAALLWRPWKRRLAQQAMVGIALLVLGVAIGVFAAGLTAGNVSASALAVVWATLFFGERGLWSVSGALLVLYVAAATTFIGNDASAQLMIQPNEWGYWLRYTLVALIGAVLSGFVVLAARRAYESMRVREFDALQARSAAETARIAAEAQADTLQRRQLVISLVTGLAKDMHALLSQDFARMRLLRDTATGREERQAAITLLANAERAHQMMADLLTLGQQTPDGVEGFDGAGVVKRMSLLLRGAMPSRVVLTVSSERSCPLSGDELKFEHVVTALALSARTALSSGGEVRVRLSRGAASMGRLDVRHCPSGGNPESPATDWTTLRADGEPMTRESELDTAVRIVGEAGGRVEVGLHDDGGKTVSVFWPWQGAARYVVS